MLDAIFSGLAGALVSGASSAGNSVLSYGFNKRMARYNAKLQLSNQRKLNRDQYELNQRSLVDSPTSQKSGLIKAGYNPMLAIADATHAPVVSGGVAGMPSANGDYGVGDLGSAFDRASNSAVQRKEQQKQIDKLAKLTDAELEKLQSESDAAIAHSSAAMYDAETRRMEALASIEKTKKEADSINPTVERENRKYGNGLIGEGMRFIRTLKEGFGASDSSVDARLGDYLPSSARQIKVITDEENRKEKRRGDAVRKRRMSH